MGGIIKHALRFIVYCVSLNAASAFAGPTLTSAIVAATKAKASALRPLSLQERATALAQRNPDSAPSAALQHRVRQRPIIRIQDEFDVDPYVNKLADTIEIIFRPDASEWGHAHIRAGDHVYDLGGSYFARALRLDDGVDLLMRESYGFVFASTPQTVAALKQTYGDKVARLNAGTLQYQLRPWETPRPEGENCETFVTNTLRELVPELNVYSATQYRGAIGLARWGLAHPQLQAVTIYSPRNIASDETFIFRKLE